MKRYKKFCLAVWLVLIASILTLSGCCFLEDERADVVFVIDTDHTVGSVGLTSARSSQGGRNADNSFMTRGESFGFRVEEYPVTVTAYGDLDGRRELASCTISQAPESGRWYVVARNRGNSIALEVCTQWPREEAGAITGAMSHG